MRRIKQLQTFDIRSLVTSEYQSPSPSPFLFGEASYAKARLTDYDCLILRFDVLSLNTFSVPELSCIVTATRVHAWQTLTLGNAASEFVRR